VNPLSDALHVGSVVRVLSFHRTDAVGHITQLQANGIVVVRLEGWQADGYHLDVAVHVSNLLAVRS
jgi:hypothetical protein